MSVSLRKAINKQECKIKDKHLSSVVAETLVPKGERKFWAYIEKLPLNRNNILSWKFCYVLHRLLSDGHARALEYAMQKRGTLIDLGHNWSLSLENYSEEIQIYTALLDTKLNFHKQFPQFPGSLKMHVDELKNIGNANNSIYVKITMAITDYLELICKLRTSIFKSLKKSKCNSMMPEGQCRLEPIVLCFQDSVRLHEIMMMILDLNPSCLPMKLTDYRNLYREQLKSFHDSFDKAMKFQFINEAMPEEIKLSQTIPKTLEGTEGAAEMILQSKKPFPQSDNQIRHQKILNETISALEEVSQQFMKVITSAKQSLGTVSMGAVKEEISPENNDGENGTDEIQVEKRDSEKEKVKKVLGRKIVEKRDESKEEEKNVEQQRDDCKEEKNDLQQRDDCKEQEKANTMVKDETTFEKKLDEFLERYFEMKLKAENANLQNKEVKTLTPEEHIHHLLELLHPSQTSESSTKIRKTTSAKNDSEIQKKKLLQLLKSAVNPLKRASSVPNVSYEASLIKHRQEFEIINEMNQPEPEEPEDTHREKEEMNQPEPEEPEDTPSETEEMNKDGSNFDKTIEEYWDLADDYPEEYMTILGQRLQLLLDKMNSANNDFEQFDLSQFKFIDETSSIEKSEDKAEDTLSTASRKSEESTSDSESDASSECDGGDGVKDEDVVDTKKINEQHFENATLSTILRQLQKLQEILIKYQK